MILSKLKNTSATPFSYAILIRMGMLIGLLAMVSSYNRALAAESTELILSEQEREDIAHIISITKQMIPHALNLADDRQYRFYKSQLRQSGKTPERYPQLYQQIEQRRRQHMDDGYEAYDWAATANGDEDYASMGEVNAITGLTGDGTGNYASTAMSSITTGSIWSTLSLGLHRASDNDPISPNQGGGGPGSQIYYGLGNTGYTSPQDVYSLYTYYWIDNDNQQHGPYTKRVMLTSEIPTIQVNKPNNQDGGKSNTNIVLCVNRAPNGYNNCNYGETSPQRYEVPMPFSGTVTYPTAVKVDNSGKPTGNDLAVILFIYKIANNPTMQTEDSNCRYWGPVKTSFFQNTTMSSNNTVLSWAFNPADFKTEPDSPCLSNGDVVSFSFSLGVEDAQQNLMWAFASSSDQHSGSNFFKMPQIQVILGCLLPGAMVELADGSFKAIEDFEAEGEQVRTGSGEILTVFGNTSGHEDSPVYVLTTESGEVLRLTKDHPVITAEQDVLLARELAVGDVIVTRDGPKTLIGVDVEDYDGPVYNIQLGTAGGDTGSVLPTFFANGILVGDAAMQQEYGMRFRARPAEVKKHLPAEWHADYQSWLEDQSS